MSKLAVTKIGRLGFTELFEKRNIIIIIIIIRNEYDYGGVMSEDC